MTALTQDREPLYKYGDTKAYPVAAGVVIYVGALVCLNASGYAVPASDTAGLVFAGVSMQRADNSTGAAGAITVRVYRRGLFQFNASGLTVGGNFMAKVYALDDNTFALTSTNSIQVGRLVEVDSAILGWIDITKAI